MANAWLWMLGVWAYPPYVGAMHESVARTSNYGAIRGGGMQRGNGATFNSGMNRSYGTSMARSSGEFGGTSARSFSHRT